MGKIIVIDGLDGSGKATQAALLEEYIKGLGINTYMLDLPYYSDDSSALVRMYLSGELGNKPSDVNAYSASTFYAVDRYASFKKHWEKHWLSDTVIIANRYTTSNACHQMTKLPKEQWDEYLDWLFSFEYGKMEIPEPEVVIFLDMPVDISQKLLSKRYEGDESKKDVHEKDVQYLIACHEAAEYACEKLGWVRIICGENGEPLTIEEIAEKVKQELKEVL